MNPEYYKEYYHLERENWWFLARKEIIRSQLKKLQKDNNPLQILNVGAALGASTIMLQEFGKVTSLEYDKSCCDYARNNLNLDFINGSITELPFPSNEFDLVCAFDVVEHVQEDQKAVNELHRVCKKGGFVFTTVPAFEFLWSEHDEVNQHVRRYTMKTYMALFNSQNSKVCFKSYFNFFLFPFVAVVRITSSFFRPPKTIKNVKSDFKKIKSKFISNVLLKIFKSESVFLNRHIRLPVGVSLMVIAKKTAFS
jgi:ubiquinone/menaquinone biosynthesis C-methylase UbiE